METNYEQLIHQARSLVDGEHDLIANMANISALLFNNMNSVNWAGFYLFKESQLVLGPFQGQPACIRIPMGKGVCGTAAEMKTTQRRSSKLSRNRHGRDSILCAGPP